jgi:allantoinase
LLELQQPRIPYSAIIDRPPLRWPNGARVALWVATNVLFFEYDPPVNPHGNPWSRTPTPDVRSYGHQDYGNRVAFWRVRDLLSELGIRSTASISLAILDHFPEIRDAMVDDGWEFMPHGVYNTRGLWDASEEEELEYYRDARDTIHKYSGSYPAGSLGPGPLTGTAQTPDLLAQAGFTYIADWSHDDQPFPVNVRSGRLISMPYSIGGAETSDVPFLRSAWDAADFERVIKLQFDRLYAEGEESGRVMCLPLHPYRIGQPHRIKYLARSLEYILSQPGVWVATADEIATHYLNEYFPIMMKQLDARGQLG